MKNNKQHTNPPFHPPAVAGRGGCCFPNRLENAQVEKEELLSKLGRQLCEAVQAGNTAAAAHLLAARYKKLLFLGGGAARAVLAVQTVARLDKKSFRKASTAPSAREIPSRVSRVGPV